MSRTCLACRHEQRAGIDEALAKGQPTRTVAHLFGLQPGVTARHKAHIGTKTLVLAHKPLVAMSGRLLKDIGKWLGQADEQLQLARADGDHAGANGALANARGFLRLIAEASGKLAEVEAAAQVKAWASYQDAVAVDEPAAYARAVRLVAAYLSRHPGERQHALEQIGGVMVAQDGREGPQLGSGTNGGAGNGITDTNGQIEP